MRGGDYMKRKKKLVSCIVDGAGPRPSPYAQLKLQNARMADSLTMLEQHNRMTKTAHEKEMNDLRVKLRENEMKAKAEIVTSAAHMIEALARMIGGPGF
jgi:endo-1,4-beta-D-glucanase Y